MGLHGKTAIVTGGTGALGQVVTRRFLHEGARVVVTARKKESAPPGADMQVADVTIEDEVRNLFRDVIASHGSVDILVNTVGGFLPAKDLEAVSLEEWQHMMSVNLLSTFLCTREGIRAMKGRGYGRIINISALHGIQPSPGRIPYSVAKAGVALLTELAAREVKRTGITINAIAPSIIVTDANKASMPDADTTQWVTPEDIAETMCFLCGEQGGVINGATLRAFGGV